MVKYAVAMMLFTGSFSAYAEMRIWTSIKGDAIEAEYIKLFRDEVVLETSAGKQFKIPVSRLCYTDKEWLANAIPPDIKITVNVDTDRGRSDSGKYGSMKNLKKKAETVKVKVVLEKTNPEPCNRDFMVQIYAVAKDTNREIRKVIGYSEREFSFKTNEAIEIEVPLSTVTYVEGRLSRGSRYEGYLVVIKEKNKEGEIVATKSKELAYEKNAPQFEQAKKGTLFDPDFGIMNSPKPKKRKRNQMR